MQTGQLRERVTIQESTKSADQARTVTWSTLAYVWANVTPTRASERIQAAGIGAQHDYKVTIRNRPDVTPKMRVLYRPFGYSTAKTLEIHGVTPLDGKREFLTLDCGERI